VTESSEASRTLGALVITLAEVACPNLLGPFAILDLDQVDQVSVFFLGATAASFVCGSVDVRPLRTIMQDVAKHGRQEDQSLVARQLHDELVECTVTAERSSTIRVDLIGARLKALS
jgi:hypothetical protein